VTVPITPIALRYKGYRGRYEVDPDEEVLHGRVDGIRDIVTFVADNLEDLEREFRTSVDIYLEWCAESGIEPNPPGPEPTPGTP
jgi:predicted HicB family RNase H-like nuclease